jgi:hypothetical protein
VQFSHRFFVHLPQRAPLIAGAISDFVIIDVGVSRTDRNTDETIWVARLHFAQKLGCDVLMGTRKVIAVYAKNALPTGIFNAHDSQESVPSIVATLTLDVNDATALKIIAHFVDSVRKHISPRIFTDKIELDGVFGRRILWSFPVPDSHPGDDSVFCGSRAVVVLEEPVRDTFNGLVEPTKSIRP